MIILLQNTLTARDYLDDLQSEISLRSNPELEQLHETILGALTEVAQAVEMIKEMIDKECAE
jgi:hypothetical protein